MAGSESVRAGSAADLKARIAAERTGLPFLVYRDGDDEQRILSLDARAITLTIGRDPANEIALDWDHEASRLHAQLARLGGQWTIADDGLSRNGTYVNAERLTGQRRLRHGDVIVCGKTSIAFRWPQTATSEETLRPAEEAVVPELTPAQRRVLVALCRPLNTGDGHAMPASNQQIADELVVTVEAVKAHLRVLFDKFQVGDLPHNHKRARLVDLAFKSGVITSRDL
jgi:pSer/pThr/pTyr-binding forkhead associated (FHA) protein